MKLDCVGYYCDPAAVSLCLEPLPALPQFRNTGAAQTTLASIASPSGNTHRPSFLNYVIAPRTFFMSPLIKVVSPLAALSV